MTAIVAQAINIAAAAIEAAVEAQAFATGYYTIAAGKTLEAMDARLLATQTEGFTGSQGTIANALADAFALAEFAPIDSRRLWKCAGGLHGCHEGTAADDSC
jgi:hypothetical protein